MTKYTYSKEYMENVIEEHESIDKFSEFEGQVFEWMEQEMISYYAHGSDLYAITYTPTI